jgi:hypothetical protein
MDRYVRTDAVCHAMNAYLNIAPHLGDGILIEVPERPLAERMALQSEVPILDHDDDEDRESADEDQADDDGR